MYRVVSSLGEHKVECETEEAAEAYLKVLNDMEVYRRELMPIWRRANSTYRTPGQSPSTVETKEYWVEYWIEKI